MAMIKLTKIEALLIRDALQESLDQGDQDIEQTHDALQVIESALSYGDNYEELDFNED